MKKLVSVVLILAISLTGVVFAIESGPDEVSSSIIDPVESVVTNNDENKGEVETPLTEQMDEIVDDVKSENKNVEDIENVETNSSSDPYEMLPELSEPLFKTGEGATESYSSLPEVNIGFTSPIFKIIALSVGVIIIILLLLSISRKKDTKYSAYKDIPPRKRVPKKPNKEELPDLEPSDLNVLPEEEIVIPPAEIEKTDDLDFNKIDNMEEDLILNLETEEEKTDMPLTDDFPNDIELVLGNELDSKKIEEIDDLDDIDDIDQLSKAIEEKEAELKKLEEEILEEKVANNTITNDNNKEKSEEELIEKPIDLEIKEEAKEVLGEKEEKSKKEETKKVTDKDNIKKDKAAEKEEIKKVAKNAKTKETSKTSEKKTEKETKKETKESKIEKEEVKSGLVEDFLKNMEKSMKEDNKK